MRNILLVAALVTLSACGASEPTQAPEKAKTPDEAMAGRYEFKGPDGKKMTSVLETDHSYIDTADGAVSDTGRWELKDGKTCFMSAAAGATAECYTLSGSMEAGNLTATPDKGEPLKLKKVG